MMVLGPGLRFLQDTRLRLSTKPLGLRLVLRSTVYRHVKPNQLADLSFAVKHSDCS